MGNNIENSSGPAVVQVFELTMDSDEDQDELNRQYRKPGEPDYCVPVKTMWPATSPPAGADQAKPST